MKRKKLLPINDNVPIYTYTYYGYPHSIIAANNRVGASLAEFEISDYENNIWIERLDNFSVSKNGDNFQVRGIHSYGEELNGVIYRRLKERDSIGLRLYYQQYSSPWGAINLFISDCPEKELLSEDDNYLCRLGFFNREGVYFRVNNVPQKLSYDCRGLPVDLLLCRYDKCVETYLDVRGKKYLLCQTELPESVENELKIGVQIKENENTYYPWLYRNFIQISCDLSSRNRPIDYHYGIEKDWDFNWYNYFLNYSKIPLDIILNYGVLHFLKDSIDKGRYIELLLDQYYIPDRREYHYAHFLHQNLVYGYDDCEKVLYLLGYSDNGRLTRTQIAYSDIKYQIEGKRWSRDIFLIEYEQDAYAMTYNPEYMKKMILQYLNGYNSSNDMGHLLESRMRVYGLKCYEELLTERGIERISEDGRILHLLYEHKALMKERLQYMRYHETLGKEMDSLISQYSDVVGRALNSRNLSVKYRMTGDERLKTKIRTRLKEMHQMEEKILSNIFM